MLSAKGRDGGDGRDGCDGRRHGVEHRVGRDSATMVGMSTGSRRVDADPGSALATAATAATCTKDSG